MDEMCYIETLYGHHSEVLGLDSLNQERALSVGSDRTLSLWKVVDETQLIAVTGELSRMRLGIGRAQTTALAGKISHFVHLAAIYDLTADADAQLEANVTLCGFVKAMLLSEDGWNSSECCKLHLS
jgi:thioester reductase-like protein